MASSGAWNWPPALLTRPSMRPVRLQDRGNRRGHRFLLADVAGVGGGLAAVLGDLGGDRGEPLRLAADEGHGGPQAAELVGRAAPDALPPPVTTITWPANRPSRKIDWYATRASSGGQTPLPQHQILMRRLAKGSDPLYRQEV
jgi:hypothetical protein